MFPGYWHGEEYVDRKNPNNYVEAFPMSNEEMKLRQAHAESRLNPNARNKRSKAAGLFQKVTVIRLYCFRDEELHL